VKLNKGFSEMTMKMYVAFFVVAIVAVVGLSGVIEPESFVGLLGVAVGYVLSEKAWAHTDPHRKRADGSSP
jgi:hypothetical protein